MYKYLLVSFGNDQYMSRALGRQARQVFLADEGLALVGRAVGVHNRMETTLYLIIAPLWVWPFSFGPRWQRGHFQYCFRFRHWIRSTRFKDHSKHAGHSAIFRDN